MLALSGEMDEEAIFCMFVEAALLETFDVMRDPQKDIEDALSLGIQKFDLTY